MFAALLFVAVGLVQEPVTVRATLSADRIQPGEALVLQIFVDTDGAAPSRVETPPLPPGVDVLRTQDFSELQLAFPGGRQRRFRREIVITAHRAGRYVIPEARITVGSRLYLTDVVAFDVAPAAGPLDAGVGRPRLHVLLDPDTVYVGQQVLLRAEAILAETERPRRARAPSFEPPSPAGFWTQDLPQARQSTLRLIGADVFEVHGFSRAYFPLHAGALVLPPASVVYEARAGMLAGTRMERLTSDSLPLTVLPLPTAQRPASFAGAVGKFTLAAELEPRRVQTGEAASLSIEIRGEGNVKGLPPPALPMLGRVAVMAAADEAESWISDGVLYGSRRFRWVLVPGEAGDVAVGPVEFSYFNPFERRYEVLTSDDLRLSVTAPTTVAPAAPPGPAIRRAPARDRLGWVRTRAFAAVHTIPVLALLLVAAWRRRRAWLERRRRAADRAAGWRAAAAAATSADELRAAIVAACTEACAPAAPGTGTIREIGVGLVEAGVAGSTAERLQGLLERLDEHRFAGRPWDDTARQTLGALGQELLGLLAQRPRGEHDRATGGAVARLLLTCAIVASSAVPVAALPAGAADATAAERDSAPFNAGLDAFDAGDFRSAALHFQTAALERPRDHAAWHNFGMAWHGLGEPGLAAAAWLRALSIAPRARDTRAGLSAVAAHEATHRYSPPLRLSGPEALLLASVLWMVLMGGVAVLMTGRSRVGRRMVFAAVLLLSAHGVSWMLHRQDRSRAAVALRAETTVRVAPLLRADAMHELPAGAVFDVLERREDWLRVRSPRGEGWIEARDAARP